LTASLYSRFFLSIQDLFTSVRGVSGTLCHVYYYYYNNAIFIKLPILGDDSVAPSFSYYGRRETALWP